VGLTVEIETYPVNPYFISTPEAVRGGNVIPLIL